MSSKFIEEVILPYFKGFNNTSINVTLLGLDGTLLYTTQMVADNMNIPLDKLLGVSYKNATAEIVSLQ